MANNFISPFGYLSGNGNLVTIYTCPVGKKTLVKGIQCSNNSNTGVQVTVVWQDVNSVGQGSSSNYLVTSGEVPAFGKIGLIEQGYIALQAGDRVDAVASQPNKIYMLISALEMDI